MITKEGDRNSCRVLTFKGNWNTHVCRCPRKKKIIINTRFTKGNVQDRVDRSGKWPRAWEWVSGHDGCSGRRVEWT